MSRNKRSVMLLGFVLSVSLIASTATALFLTEFHSRAFFRLLGAVCGDIMEAQPDVTQAVQTVLKEYKLHPETAAEENVLPGLGYRRSDFLRTEQTYGILLGAAGFAVGGALFILTLGYRNRKETQRLKELAAYLEKANTGKCDVLFPAGEDEFSRLQDEIGKTVTMLCRTKEQALEARNNYAENLSNIAHQLKTPITAISLSAQMMESGGSGEYAEQIMRQLARLTHLEEALLLLSRIDAGTLALEKQKVDVFTLLMLAADNLQEVFQRSDVSVDIPELGEMEITADREWTMEAVMNLMKNCMEHTPPGGMVHCSYAQNPIYTEILIWDEGQGFAREDIPRLFERFYRGQNAEKNGIGIGLSIAKEIIEKQNGTIRAENLRQGGACFEIRFYCH